MKNSRFALFALVLLPVCSLISCGPESSESTDTEGSSASAAAEGQAAEAPNTGNRFLDAAIQKVSAANPALSMEQSQKVVESMTADGSIGLGEINSMKLDDLSQNADRLNQAYQKALGEVK